MKRFLLFRGDHYYPNGGWGDFQGAFDTIEDAKAAIGDIDSVWEWAHIVDASSEQRVFEI